MSYQKFIEPANSNLEVAQVLRDGPDVALQLRFDGAVHEFNLAPDDAYALAMLLEAQADAILGAARIPESEVPK